MAKVYSSHDQEIVFVARDSARMIRKSYFLEGMEPVYMPACMPVACRSDFQGSGFSNYRIRDLGLGIWWLWLGGLGLWL